MSKGSWDIVFKGMPNRPAPFSYILCLLNFHELPRDYQIVNVIIGESMLSIKHSAHGLE